MKVQRTLLSVSLGLSVFTFPLSAHAWGPEGHRITGLVAYELLTPQARAAVRYYLGSDDLAAAAVWMDQNRPTLGNQFPGSSAWHFDDVPVCPDPSVDTCPNGNCASNKIASFDRMLSDSDATKDDRTLALRLVVHMVGDIHQPLHSADNHDRGGNQISVLLNGRNTNLHAAWDTGLVRASLRGSSEQRYAEGLRTTYRDQIKGWQSGTVQSWIQEAHQLAIQDVYGGLGGFQCPANTAGTQVTLDAAYQAQAGKDIPLQLARGGARIAYVLNQAFAGFTRP